VEGTMLYKIFSNKIPLNPPFSKGEIRFPPLEKGGKGGFEQLYSNEISIFSTHHQSVKSPGKGLIVSALSSDGVVEAIELPDYPFLIGVQWHPEREPESEYTRLLFKTFIEAASHRTK